MTYLSIIAVTLSFFLFIILIFATMIATSIWRLKKLNKTVKGFQLN
ncbi:hypothetical protein SDC9_20794 [bioreactor metagenome]|uniref:Uncharacterized protein n=1 Tax=bioreactor metagenome TaxID=1076179 RepID=A0A644U7P9_9ZZZZ